MKDIEEDDDYQDIYKSSPVPLEYVAALQFQKIYGNILGQGTAPPVLHLLREIPAT